MELIDSLRRLPVVGAEITECVGTAEQVEVLAPIVEAIGALLRPAGD